MNFIFELWKQYFTKERIKYISRFIKMVYYT